MTANWKFEIPRSHPSVKSSPAADGTHVYALVNHGASSDGESVLRLYALAIEDGLKQSQCDISRRAPSALVVGDDRVYVSNTHGAIHAIRKSIVEVEWTYSTDAPIHSSPALYDQRLFVRDINGDFYTIDAANGTKQ
ncbi:PQQ-binding-like beta-propeller repeat protein [Halomontanus rarus]|uniref:outer membrane protein assembly factor BamB family protein n=1 Tax=Halomontanus rarus TaxID=3034020 RepID=UPI00293BFAF7|nr:PQQ-binding-like beta-propeller repeat protein [Halovivax sp. KZCA124]